MKRIIICMDGTWQNIAWQMLDIDPITEQPIDRRTNIGKIAMQICPQCDRNVPQIVYYSPGVGRRTFVDSNQKIANYEGATGEGSEENIIGAYLFLSFNYQPGDEIYLFGFSRGAFGVRSLAGLIWHCGILKQSELARVRNALFVYRETDPDRRENLGRQFRAAYSVAPVLGRSETPADAPHKLFIHYVGVFDTVVMRGSPVSTQQVAKGFAFHNLKLGNHIYSARHALALDEDRNTLPVTPFSNVGEFCRLLDVDPCSPDARYQQKWFAGRHGDVGGGESRGLSEVSRKWVLRGAVARGLKVTESLKVDADPQGPDYFMRGEVERSKLLSPMSAKLWRRRQVFPEPPDPTEADAGPQAKAGPATLRDLDQHVHVSTVLRYFDEQRRNPFYRPGPLRPFRRLLNQKDGAFTHWLNTRKDEMFV